MNSDSQQNKAQGVQHKKRILVVSQRFWPENFRIGDIVEGFIQDGFEVDILCGLPNYPKGEWFEGYRYLGPRKEKFHKADVFRAGEIRRKGNTSLRIFLNYTSFPFFSLFSLPRLHGRRYDAVFCYETSPVLMMLPAIVYSKLHRVPLTTYVLDLWPENLYSVLPVKNKLLRAIASGVSHWHYRRSDNLIAISDELALRLKAMFKNKKKKAHVEVIPQYCEDFYAKNIEDPSLRKKYSGWFNILFTGNISPAQDLENLVDAMEIVKQKSDRKIRCLVVGDGMSRDSLESYSKEKGLSEYFIFCGQQPAADIPKWTTFADALFAGLAKSEDLGLTVPAKITSYFAAGRPMLVAADKEAARVAGESGAALVSPAGDSKGLAENILALAAMEPNQREDMGRFGKACYESHYKRRLLLTKLEQCILRQQKGGFSN